MNKKFTKVYEEEDVRLRGCSYNVASVYFHLKNKRDYFKNKNQNNSTCYDLTKYISEYTGICEKTVKRAIKTLKEIGLISTVIKGKVNHYSFPVLDAIENGTEIPEKQNKTDLNHQNIQDDISVHQEQDIQPESLKIDVNEELEYNNIENNKDMGNLTNIVYDSTTGRFQFTNEQKEEIKNKIIKVAASKQSSKTELTDEQKYGSDVMDFVEDYDIVLKALRADIDYRKFGEKDKELLANTANDKIKDAIVQNGNTTPDFISKLQEFFKNYQINYYNDKLNDYETDI